MIAFEIWLTFSRIEPIFWGFYFSLRAWFPPFSTYFHLKADIFSWCSTSWATIHLMQYESEIDVRRVLWIFGTTRPVEHRKSFRNFQEICRRFDLDWVGRFLRGISEIFLLRFFFFGMRTRKYILVLVNGVFSTSSSNPRLRLLGWRKSSSVLSGRYEGSGLP